MTDQGPTDRRRATRLRVLLDTGGFNRVVRGRYGALAYNRHDDVVGRLVEKYGEYIEGEADLFRQIVRPGDIVCDVGANIGLHTLALSQAVGPSGRVFAFEPQRIVFQTLCANLALNSVTNVEAHWAAVTDHAGLVHMPPLRYDVEHNFGGVGPLGGGQGEPVTALRLDDAVRVGRLKLVKIDVEGMEAEVIRGARGLIDRFRPLLYVENDRLDKSEALIRLIVGCGYRLFWHLPPVYNPHNYAAEEQNIYPGAVTVNMLCLPREAPAELSGFTEITDPQDHPHQKKDDGRNP